MKEIIKDVVPSKMGNMRIDIEEFIKLYNAGECELIDIRVPFEVARWQLNFGLKIPADELPDRLDELPENKLLVVACPGIDRSNVARTYLASRKFNVKYLQGGLLGLMTRLKGGLAKNLEPK